MKIPYKNELNELIRWISNANAIIGSSRQITHLVQEVQQVTRLITVVSNGIQEARSHCQNHVDDVPSFHDG